MLKRIQIRKRQTVKGKYFVFFKCVWKKRCSGLIKNVLDLGLVVYLSELQPLFVPLLFLLFDEVRHDINWQGKDDGRVLLSRNACQSLEISQLQVDRRIVTNEIDMPISSGLG